MYNHIFYCSKNLLRRRYYEWIWITSWYVVFFSSHFHLFNDCCTQQKQSFTQENWYNRISYSSHTLLVCLHLLLLLHQLNFRLSTCILIRDNVFFTTFLSDLSNLFVNLPYNWPCNTDSFSKIYGRHKRFTKNLSDQI